jgi:hypothetical protein
MTKNVRRALAAGAITAIGFSGTVVPAHAVDAATCDPVTLSVAIESATAQARAAQKAFTTHTSTSMQALAGQLHTTEAREARAAARKANQLARKAAKLDGKAGKAARQAAKAARAVARAEAREAARLQRAGTAQLRAIIKTDRDRLKAEWTAAKVALARLKAQAEGCVADESEADEPAV